MADQHEGQTQPLKRASDLYRKGDRAGAAKAFGRALDSSPELAQNPAAQKLAAHITGLAPEKAVLLLADPAKRDAFVLRVGRAGPQPRTNRVNLVLWGFALVFVAVVVFILATLIATGNFLR